MATAAIKVGADTQDAIKGFGALSHALDDAGKEFAKFGKVVASGRNVLEGAVDGILDVGRGLTIMNPLAGIAVTVVGGLIKSFFEAKKAAEETARSLSKEGNLVEALKSSEYKEAIKNISNLKFEIQAAKEGVADKTTVLNHYNETIGKTTGQVASLDQAERELTKNGDAYVKMTLYKAAANIALEKAAQKALDAEQIRLKKNEEFRNGLVDNVSVSNGGGAGVLGGGIRIPTPGEIAAEEQRIKKAQQRRKDAAIREQTKAQEEFENIAKKFQSDAKKIASDNGFSIIPTDDKKTVEKVESVFDKVHEAMRGLLYKLGLDWDKAGNEAADAYYDSLLATFKKRQDIKDQLAGTTEAIRKGIVGFAPTGTNNKDTLSEGLGIGQKSAGELDKEHEDRLKKIHQAVTLTDFAVQSLGGAFTEMFEGIASGSGNALKSLGQAIAGIIKKLIAAALTAAIFAAILASTGIGAAAGGGGFSKNFSKVFSSLSGIPKFAKGGIVTSPTLAMVGEGGEPEIISPDSKMRKIVREESGGGGGQLTARIEGRDIVFLYDTNKTANNRKF